MAQHTASDRRASWDRKPAGGIETTPVNVTKRQSFQAIAATQRMKLTNGQS